MPTKKKDLAASLKKRIPGTAQNLPSEAQKRATSDDQPKKRITIDLEKPLYMRLKMACMENEETVRNFVIRAIETELSSS